MQAMVKEGRTGHQMAYSKRDIEYLERNGWRKLEQEKPEKRKPGRPKLTLKGKP